MKFGIPLWYGDKDLAKGIHVAQRMGADFVEIALDFNWPESIPAGERTKIKKASKASGVEIACHLPWASTAIASPRERVRKASLEAYEECIDFSSKLDASHTVFHITGITEAQRLQVVQRAMRDIAKRSVEETVDCAQSAGVTPVLENNGRYHGPASFCLPGEIAPLLKIRGLRFCLDVGHVYKTSVEAKNSGVKEKTDIKTWVEKTGGKIHVLHLHDCIFKSDGSVKDHIMLGSGSLDLKKIAAAISTTRCEYVLSEAHRRKSGVEVNRKDYSGSLNAAKQLFEQKS